jgi:hypothetical protein
VRTRHLLPLALLALVPILLAPAGSAKPPTKTWFEICVQNATGGTVSPDCSATGASPTFAGNAPATIQLSVINDSSSTTQLTAATITVPPQLRVIANTAAPSKYVASSGQTISFSGLNLPGGKSFTATFQANVACGGQADWSQQPQLSGNPFEYQNGKSTGVPSAIDTACHLRFTTQPTDTQNASSPPTSPPHYIRDGGASVGNPISIGLVNENGDAIGCPTGWDNCSVTVGKAQVAGTLNGTLTKQLSAATFGDLTMEIGADLADQFNLTATAVDAFAPTVSSSSFLVAQNVTSLACPGQSCATNGHQQVGGFGAPSFVDITTSSGFNFMTVSPFTLATRSLPDGCAGLAGLKQPVGVTGFAESDSRRPGSGTLTIRYYVNKDILSARYGKNVGNQFVPMCVGARPVNTDTGEISDCNPNDPNAGWLGDAITSTGKFAGGDPVHAICDPDGYYYGIISSYQDKLDASANPTVTNWGGTQIGGDNYRFFDMSIPPGWDWRSGP